MSAPLRVFVIAGEPSGDQLGAHLLAGLKSEADTVDLQGIGGPLMAGEGLQSLFAMSDLSVMGLTEVLPRLPKLLRRVREAADAVLAMQPDVLITIDSPDFCLRVAKRVKAASSIPTVHYVAPSVWAWREGRAAKMAKVIDHVLALLPFEPPYMEAAGMSCDFVGHPVARLPRIDAQEAAEFRARHGFASKARLLCVLPGSRQGEIRRIGPVFADCIAALSKKIDGLRVVIPAAPNVAEAVNQMFTGTGAVVLNPAALGAQAEREKHCAFAASDVALASSGTVSLELARQEVPMVIGYRMAPLTEFILRRSIKIDTGTLTNIVTDTRYVPEFLFDDFKADAIVDEVTQLLTVPGAAQDQLDASRAAIRSLGAGDDDPGLRAARSAIDFIGRLAAQ